MKISKGEKTRRHIIENTAPVFNRKGVSGTSLSDIMNCTGLSKGAIYGAFQDKQEISLAVFKQSAKKMKETVLKSVDTSSAKNRILSLLDFFLKNAFNPPVPGGCPLFNTAVEADDTNILLKEAAARELLDSVRLVEEAFREGKENGEFPAPINPAELAFSLFCALEGALVMSRVSSSLEPMKNVVRFWKRTVKELGSR